MAWLLLLLVPPALAVALDRWGRRALPSDGSWDAIVVAGCKVDPDGRPSVALDRRVRLAARLYADGRAPRVLMTGGGLPSEARVAAGLAAALGVPGAAIVLEERSATTEENARFAREELGAARVLVVTDAYHVLRCERVFRRYFGEARGAGAAVPRLVALRMGLREVGSLAVYAARGRL